MSTVTATLVSTEGDYLEAVIEVDGRRLTVMDCFRGSELQPGAKIEVELSAGVLREDEPWESMFGGNPESRRDLEAMDGWRYRAYGVVLSNGPTLVDCGVLVLEAPISTHDDRVVGESIAFTVERLDASSTDSARS